MPGYVSPSTIRNNRRYLERNGFTNITVKKEDRDMLNELRSEFGVIGTWRVVRALIKEHDERN